jgi:lipoprotein-anchoring transpeptidase ErfK/SrfK
MSNRQVPGSWYGHQSALPVVAATPDRLLVRLAQRPNGATTWINRDKAVLRVTHWAIVIDLSRHFLYAFYDGVQQYAFPVGNGASATPTPTGEFFVAFHAPSNGYGYGPVNIATSAHSTVFRSFEGGDDAIIAIHGPIGSDWQIGNHGAAISNGCIRMHLGDLAQVVRHVPDGAPIIITR